MRKKALWIVGWSLLIVSCRCITPVLALRYDPIGPAVLEATRQLSAEFPDGPPAEVTGEMYMSLLKNNHYDNFYSVLKSYQVKITIIEKAFIVHVYQGRSRILIDWSETEGMIDCWCYKGECKDDWLHRHLIASDYICPSEFLNSCFPQSSRRGFGNLIFFQILAKEASENLRPNRIEICGQNKDFLLLQALLAFC